MQPPKCENSSVRCKSSSLPLSSLANGWLSWNCEIGKWNEPIGFTQKASDKSLEVKKGSPEGDDIALQKIQL
jgi:hypothetical protein